MLNFFANHSDIIFLFFVSVGLICVLLVWCYYWIKSTEMLPEKILEKKVVKAKLVDMVEYTGLYLNYETRKEEVMTLYKLIFEYELDGEIYRAETPRAWTQEYKDEMVKMQEEGIFTDEIFVTVSLRDYSIIYSTPPCKFNKERNNFVYDYKKKQLRKSLLDKGFNNKQIDKIDMNFYANIENHITMVYLLASLFGALSLIWLIGIIKISVIITSYLTLI